MKLLLTAVLGLVAIAPLASAQTAPSAPLPAAAPKPAPSTAKFSLDTPIEQIVADPAAKAALEKTLPGITGHEAYESFKAMSLRVVQPYSQGQLTDEMMKKIEADLATVK